MKLKDINKIVRMNNNSSLKGKERIGLRKIFTEYVRYLPLIHSIAFTISTNLACSGKYFRVIDFIFALSYNSILLYYVVGLYQNWCWKFRLGIYYLTLVLTMSLCDYYFRLPLTNDQYSDCTLMLFVLFVGYYMIRSAYDKYSDDRI
jgi:hypothetical protein